MSQHETADVLLDYQYLSDTHSARKEDISGNLRLKLQS